MSFVEHLQSVIAYAPIPLFAESLRVQEALIVSILTRQSTLPCLTGCIKDLGRLWGIDDFELFGQFEGLQSKVVTSLRHGNTFQLANKAILDVYKLTGRKSSKGCSKAHAGLRETVLNLNFVAPGSNGNDRLVSWTCISFIVLEIAIQVLVCAMLAFNGAMVGATLAGCVGVTTTTLLVLRLTVNPIFANSHAIAADQALTAVNGAAMDVHVVADSWNSSELDVFCGYSSQLHCLTNIPVRSDGHRVLKWSCRIVAVVLILQAALLASLNNLKDAEPWSAAIWLSMYVSMYSLERVVYYLFPTTNFKEQPASFRRLEPLYFSGRQAALLFIAMLPVSHRVDRWAWWDVYMPDNTRRRTLQKEFEDTFKSIMETKMDQSTEKVGDSSQRYIPTTNPAILEALSAFEGSKFAEYLKAFKQITVPEITQRSI